MTPPAIALAHAVMSLASGAITAFAAGAAAYHLTTGRQARGSAYLAGAVFMLIMIWHVGARP